MFRVKSPFCPSPLYFIPALGSMPAPTPPKKTTCKTNVNLYLWSFFSSSSFPILRIPLWFLLLSNAMLSHFSHVRLCVRPHRQQPTRLPRPWDSLGKNTGVGCHFLLQCMKVKSESEVAQSCPTLSDPKDCSPPGSSVHGIFQARVLEWGAALGLGTCFLQVTFS